MKNRRQSAIISIINTKVIKTHEQLVSELQNMGYNVTQATVSRDIKDLCIIKRPDGVYAVSDGISGGGFSDSVKGIEYGGNIVVVKTAPGAASAVAAFTDELLGKDILGSIAGDDTIFIAVRECDRAEYVYRRLKAVFTENA